MRHSRSSKYVGDSLLGRRGGYRFWGVVIISRADVELDGEHCAAWGRGARRPPRHVLTRVSSVRYRPLQTTTDEGKDHLEEEWQRGGGGGTRGRRQAARMWPRWLAASRRWGCGVAVVAQWLVATRRWGCGASAVAQWLAAARRYGCGDGGAVASGGAEVWLRRGGGGAVAGGGAEVGLRRGGGVMAGGGAGGGGTMQRWREGEDATRRRNGWLRRALVSSVTATAAPVTSTNVAPHHPPHPPLPRARTPRQRPPSSF